MFGCSKGQTGPNETVLRNSRLRNKSVKNVNVKEQKQESRLRKIKKCVHGVKKRRSISLDERKSKQEILGHQLDSKLRLEEKSWKKKGKRLLKGQNLCNVGHIKHCDRKIVMCM